MFEALLSNRTVSVLVEALPRILTAGLTMTIPLTLVSFFFAMIIAVVVALVQYANVPVLRQIARFYIWVIRGTPLLVQLFIIFYGLPSLGIMPVSYTHLDVYKRQAHTNAVERLARESGRYAREEKLLDELAQVLGLTKPPRAIESYNISNWGDGTSVCGMVTFKDGKPFKAG